MKYFFVLALLSALSSVAAVEKQDLRVTTIEPDTYVVCKNNSIVRTIRIEKDEKGCEAKYTKSGEDRIIGFGRHRNSCDPFLKNVQANLEKADWRCRSIKNAKISASVSGSDE